MQLSSKFPRASTLSVHCSPSGYNDRAGFLKIAQHFLTHAPGAGKHDLFLFIDGHDSHWCPEALQLLKTNKVHVFFLRAANSENDQPNDNGPNAHIKALHSEMVEARMCALAESGDFRTTKMCAQLFNEIFQATWAAFQLDAGRIIVSAFARTGLHPYNPNASNYTASNAAAASGFTGDVPSSVLSPDGQELPAAAPIRWDSPVLTAIALADKPNESVILRKAVLEWFLRPRSKTSAQAVKDANNAARARKNVLNGGLSTRNPDTTCGLGVTSSIIAQARQSQENKNKRAALAVERKSAKRQRLDGQAVQRTDAWRDLISKFTSTTSPIPADAEAVEARLNTREFLAPALSLAGQHRFAQARVTPASWKKGDVAAALAPLVLEALRGAPDPVPAPACASDDEIEEDFDLELDDDVVTQ